MHIQMFTFLLGRMKHLVALSLSCRGPVCGGLHGVLSNLLILICMSSSSDPSELAGETYQQTDAAFLESEKDTVRDDGSTASTAVLVGNHLFVANVGDSRTVISKAGKGIVYFNISGVCSFGGR